MKKLSLTVLAAAIATAGFVAGANALTGAPAATVAVPGLAAPAVTLPDNLVQLAQAEPDVDVAVLMTEGANVYRQCAGCHGQQGEGGMGLRLVASLIVNTVGGLVEQIIEGAEHHGMPPFAFLTDREIAAVATYVRNSWGNDFGPIQPSQVAPIRADLATAGPAE